jgi:hypothetical protein
MVLREPLFGLTMPAVDQQWYVSGDGRSHRIVVIQQADDSALQERITEMCDLLRTEAGVRSFAVDEAEGPIRPIDWPSSMSSGVAEFVRQFADDVTLWGVDADDLHREHRRTQSTLAAGRKEIEDAARPVFDLLTRARKRRLPPNLRELRAEVTNRGAGGDVDLQRLLVLLDRAAQESGHDLAHYTTLTMMRTAMRLERDLDVAAAERQRAEFAGRVVAGVTSWFPGSSRGRPVTIADALPFLLYWLDRIGLPARDFERSVEAGHADKAFGECAFWYLTSVVSSALSALQAGRASEVEFYDELMRLALATGIPFFDLVEFRKYVTYLRIASQVPVTRAWDELVLCSESLATTPDAVDLVRAEAGFLELYRGLTMSMDPAEADRVQLGSGQATSIVADIVRLARAPERRYARIAPALERFVPAAADYVRCAQRRGERMVDQTMRILREEHQDRIVMVVGGFHTRAVVRALEDRPTVSWCVLTPDFTPSTRGQVTHR